MEPKLQVVAEADENWQLSYYFAHQATEDPNKSCSRR